MRKITLLLMIFFSLAASADEKLAIKQYISAEKKIDDSNIISIIDRIILDEEVHIQILTELSKKYLTP